MKETKEKREERHDKIRMDTAIEPREFMPVNFKRHILYSLAVVLSIMSFILILFFFLWLVL